MIDFFMDFVFCKIIIPILVTMLLCFLLFIPYAIYQSCANPSPTFSLTKDQWSCSDSRTYTTTTMIMSGKVMVPMVQTHNECIQWSKR